MYISQRPTQKKGRLRPNFHNLEPARQARRALSSLRCEPRKIAQELALLNKTYEEVKESLCAVYPRRPSFTLQEFYELKCTSMAEIETYYKNKVRIGLAINLPKSAIVQALSNGVPRHYGNRLKMAQPSEPKEWLCLAQQLAYEGDNTSTKAAQQRSPRQSRAPSTTVDKTPSYPCPDISDLYTCGPQRRATPKIDSACRCLRGRSNDELGRNQLKIISDKVISLRPYRTPYAYQKEIQDQGIAGVLKQVHPDGNIYNVQYYSRALRFYERNYTISELECLAIVECVDKFRVYLLGTRFVIYSDHHALQWLKTIKDPTGRLFRWSLRLSAYDYEVKYLKGSRQYEADLLSRNPFCGFLSTPQIKDHQGELRRDTRYILNDKDLMTITRRGVTKIIVPPSLRGTLLQRAHRDFNHPGISQMTRRIAAQYYWDGMTNDIRTHVRACSICQLVKPPKGPIYGELGQLPPAVLPYELVSLDTISGFAKYGNSQTFLHVVVDHATRYAWAFPSRSTSILTYTQVIKKVMQFGSPKRLLTDRAPAFTSPKFRRFLIRHNIGQLLTTSNSPQANGLSERLNATITGKLKLLRLQQPKTAWTKLLPHVGCHLEDAEDADKNQEGLIYLRDRDELTPFTIFAMIIMQFDFALTNARAPFGHVEAFRPRKKASLRTEQFRSKWKIKHDSHHPKYVFKEGDLVIRKIAFNDPRLIKTSPKYEGPFHRMNIANEMLDSVRDDPNLLQRVITSDEAGVVHHEFLPQGRTVNKEYYLQVMRNLREAIRQKCPDLWKNKNWLLHHDNAPAHTSLLVRDFLAKNNTLMMPQPPYSPDLAPL
ncbi:hypothetical protein LAZ67_4003429 [Cordylochernes scorpioides]|uniref:RNA-directed DNA polymerase n=1 Tax=Cordylochernes scorpioides TaxID=51811 RepID=A0ABY6KDU0_9ARAC|nr:hypothetical protein LAZ67_4003429 [Cordylochernes scorpioides]